MITQRTRLDMRPGGVLPVVHVSQYDNDAAALIFDLYDDGELFSVPSGSSVLLNGLKPDNYGFSYQAASISGNTVVCNLTTQMTAVAGAVVCELRVRNGAGTQIIGSSNFILQVEAAALTDDTIISDTMIPLIEQAVEIASNLDRYITQTQSNAEIAQEAATTATTAAQSAQIVDANVTGLYNSIEEAKTNANTAAANANTVAANIAAAAARGDYKGDKGDKGDSGITTPVWGMYTMYVDESTGDLWLVTNGEYGSEYWFRYDSETGLLYYCTPDYVEKTVSGELIEITDGADLGALQCKVAFSPIQSGTGDPSPDNIRPISGRTGMTVTRAGKNLLKMPTYAEIQAAPSAVGYKSITLNLAPNTTYYLSTTFINGYTANGKGMYILLTNSATTNEPWVAVAHSGNVNGKVNGVMTTGADGILYLRFNGATEEKLTELYANSQIQLEVGSTATPYTPYVAPTTIPITWESIAGTVYGGTLDVVSGVLTVDKYLLTCGETITPTGSSYAYATNPNRWQIALYGDYMPSEDKMGESISDTFGYYNGGLSQWADGTFRFSAIQSGGYRLIQFKWADQPTTVEDLKALLAENPIHFVIPLATPQTYQLTPTEVRTLLGINNIWSDGDTIEAFTYVSESYDEEG